MKLCLVCNFQFGDEQDLCPKDLSKLVPIGKDPLIGKLIQDRYRIEKVVAKGSMGVVYKAVQELIGREVAVKVMHGYLVSDDESLKRYHKEAKAASRLNHPNITTIYDFGVLSSGQPYIVMDLLTGKTLADILKERGQLTTNQTLMVFQQVCLGLGEAHKCGVVHRDIKPENIVIDELPDGRSIHVKVVDFGIATFSEGGDDTLGKITKTGTVCGSPFYMSPEQCDASKVDLRSDLYSLGVVLFEALTGKVPFESKDIYQVLTMHVKDPPPRLKRLRPDIQYPEELEIMVSKALAKEPGARFQSASEFWDALAASAGFKKASTKEVARSAEELGDMVRSKQAAKANLKEPTPPQAPGGEQDGASNEELQQKIRAATLVLQDKEEKSNKRKKKKNSPVTPLDSLIAMCQIILPPVLTVVITVVLFWVMANEAMINSMLARKYGPSQTQTQAPTQPADIETLIASDRLPEARALLEKRKKERALTAEETEHLDWVYIRLAKKEAKAKRYKQASALIDLVSPEMKNEEEVKVLVKKFKKASAG